MIQRANNKLPFAMIKIDVLRSGLLTLEELGLYTVMLSRTDNWDFSEFVLSRELGMTPGEVHDILKRLERKGFTRERKGRYGPVWDLFELSDQLPKRKQHRDYIVPQDVAKPLVDRLLSGQKPVLQQNTEHAEQDAERAPEDERTMTNEEMANAFFAQAEKLRKIAAERRYNGSDRLPNADR